MLDPEKNTNFQSSWCPTAYETIKFGLGPSVYLLVRHST